MSLRAPAKLMTTVVFVMAIVVFPIGKPKFRAFSPCRRRTVITVESEEREENSRKDVHDRWLSFVGFMLTAKGSSTLKLKEKNVHT